MALAVPKDRVVPSPFFTPTLTLPHQGEGIGDWERE